MATSSTHRGWKYDKTNNRLQAMFNGTEVFDFDENDVVFSQSNTVITGNVTLCGDLEFCGNLTSSLKVTGGPLIMGNNIACGTRGSIQLRQGVACGTTVTVRPSVVCGATTWAFTFPPNDGSCGQQLATDGCGVTSWAAACSSIETKDILGPTCKYVAFDRVKNTTIYDYTYKPGYGLKSKVPYTGPVAEEAPFLMRGGQAPIFSDINGFGHLAAAFQVLVEKVEKLEASLETCNP